jgi:hypothetical protein
LSREPGLDAAQLADLAALIAEHLAPPEPWQTKQTLASHLHVSVRWIEYRLVEGLPHHVIAGKPRFKISKVEDWLGAHGHMRASTPT